MRVRLLRRWRTYPIGQVIEVFDPVAKIMIGEDIAEKYSGDYPPAEKMKTDFFKPKNKKRNGKD